MFRKKGKLCTFCGFLFCDEKCRQQVFVVGVGQKRITKKYCIIIMRHYNFLYSVEPVEATPGARALMNHPLFRYVLRKYPFFGKLLLVRPGVLANICFSTMESSSL